MARRSGTPRRKVDEIVGRYTNALNSIAMTRLREELCEALGIPADSPEPWTDEEWLAEADDLIAFTEGEGHETDMVDHDIYKAMKALRRIAGDALRQRDRWLDESSRNEQFQNGLRQRAEAAERELAELRDDYIRYSRRAARWRAELEDTLIERGKVAESRLEASRANCARCAKDLEETQAVLDRCTGLLTRVAEAVRGPQPQGVMYDWSGLPGIVADLVDRCRVLRGALSGLVAETALRDDDRSRERVATDDEVMRAARVALAARGADEQ